MALKTVFVTGGLSDKNWLTLRIGGYAPLCYERDVTAAMIADYRRAQFALITIGVDPGN